MPVGILVILLGWDLVSVWITLTRREPLDSSCIEYHRHHRYHFRIHDGGVGGIILAVLFFGTANAILDAVVENEQVGNKCRTLLVEMSGLKLCNLQD